MKAILVIAAVIPYAAALVLALGIAGAALAGVMGGLALLAWVAAVSLTSSFLLGR